jgi:hypothetical protein
MKKLTQDIFKPYKAEVFKAAIDSYGTAWGFTAKHIAGETGWNELEKTAAMTVVLIGHGYDATDWQNSAIDRL